MCPTCRSLENSPSAYMDHIELHHGFTGPSRMIAAEPETFMISPYGLADQNGLPTYTAE